ncbi:hypothetical protein GE09DRAFT_1104901 [Coniochaeta sp. 2T2.1]|nr:hypothetical protein GE09DRAFT_1104901 [Coniochaeta sp. 2T2.1]
MLRRPRLSIRLVLSLICRAPDSRHVRRPQQRSPRCGHESTRSKFVGSPDRVVPREECTTGRRVWRTLVGLEALGSIAT